MNSVREILARLHANLDARGCMVMMHDGISVAHVVQDRLPPDQAAAFTSFLTSSLRRVLKETGLGAFKTLTMHSAHGKVLIHDLGASYLVVVLDECDSLVIDGSKMRSSVRELRRVLQISI